MRSAGTIPSDTKSLAIIARVRNEEDTGSIPAGGILSHRRESMQRVAEELPHVPRTLQAAQRGSGLDSNKPNVSAASPLGIPGVVRCFLGLRIATSLRSSQ